jgi:hypothetical protein
VVWPPKKLLRKRLGRRLLYFIPALSFAPHG